MTTAASDVDIFLPEKFEKNMYLELEEEELNCYSYIQRISRRVLDDILAKRENFSCILGMFTRLIQASIAPYLITKESKRDPKKASKCSEDKLPWLYTAPQ